jgi:hypothetical protein
VDNFVHQPRNKPGKALVGAACSTVPAKQAVRNPGVLFLKKSTMHKFCG